METVLLTNCGTSFEADVIKSVLDGAGIPCMIVDQVCSKRPERPLRPVTMPLRKLPSRKQPKKRLLLRKWKRTKSKKRVNDKRAVTRLFRLRSFSRAIPGICRKRMLVLRTTGINL